MKNVVGTFHKIQKAYYQYCYQAVEPDGIKTTPGGITIKGINELEHAGFTSAVIKAIKASK